MARNKVQFQKSMSIHTFIQRYSDEAQCQQRLFDIRWPQGFQLHIPTHGDRSITFMPITQ